MITDKNGNELKLGDEVTVRGRITSLAMDLQEDGKGILQVLWPSGTPMLAYVESKIVEKAEQG
jgi:hypothetical protein